MYVEFFSQHIIILYDAVRYRVARCLPDAGVNVGRCDPLNGYHARTEEGLFTSSSSSLPDSHDMY